MAPFTVFCSHVKLSRNRIIKEERRICSTAGNCRKLVTFFKQSNLATAKLNHYCADFTKKKLKQEVPTRWNSTYLMIQSLLDLKEQVSDTVRVLRRDELDLLEKEWLVLSGIFLN